MSDRVRQLVEREARLKARCAAQRAAVARDVAGIEARFARVDRAARVARTALRHPIVVAAGIGVVLAVGRSRGLRLVGNLYLLSTAVGRLVHTIRLFRGLASKPSPTVRGEQL